MTQSKPYDDSNWKQEYLGYKHVNKKQRELLENGAKSLSQSWLLGAMYSEWKQMKGYNKYDPKENVGQMQSSMKDFFKDHG
tara:strand:- start:8 stop:250 length:243 start_codon:yes stop_codon:yes gene_type:complete